ncbi:Variant-specific surface protein [Giardia duodenalis assemblage B]|uniref:Variant-specific surface protein n=1 Tax=Giardia duodenalis assemblage B TaxID=1394984 RepID=A0A132NMG7_GIAIN|nr:Variant-specific surface protein [Giardia intestinalis assemblage B]
MPIRARSAPADTTSLAARAHPASPTAEASRASGAVRAARLQLAAPAPSSATSWVCLLGPSPHVPVGMSALLLVSHVSPHPYRVRRMVAERPRGSG